MTKLAETIRENVEGRLDSFRNARHLTGGVIEGINGLAQAARAQARGYSNPTTLILMIYLNAGQLRFDLPADTHRKQRGAHLCPTRARSSALAGCGSGPSTARSMRPT